MHNQNSFSTYGSPKSIQLENAFNQLILTYGPYDIFFHASFRTSTWQNTAVKRFKYFFKHLNTKEFKFFEKYIKAFLLIENNPSCDGVHMHAFINGISAEYADLLQEKSDAFFGKSKVEPYDSEKNGTHYLGWKYLTDYKIADYDLYKINARLRK